MIDMLYNFNRFEQQLKFESEHDFYFIQVIKRNKDQKDDIGKNSIVIKDFFINSIRDYKDKKSKMQDLADENNARVMGRLNVRNYEKLSLKMMKLMVEYIESKTYIGMNNMLAKVAGQYHSDPNKKWLLDFDEPFDQDKYNNLDLILHGIEPRDFNTKVIGHFPSPNGYHVITRPFNLKKFKETEYGNIDVHKDNPVNIYVPETI